MIMTVGEFIEKTKAGNEIPDALSKQVDGEIREDRKDGEYRSWVNSYKELASVLSKVLERVDKESKQYENIQILLEYNLARTPFRCDVILMGKKNEQDKLLIVELKQWENGNISFADNENVLAYGERREHPVLQVIGYERIFKEGYAAVSENGIIVESCAFLHNYIFKEDRSQDPLVKGYESIVENGNVQSKMFGKDDYDEFAQFLEESFDGESDTIENLIFNSEIRLESFIQNIANILEGKPVFTPTEDQNKILGNIIANLNENPNEHQVFIVKGGPGTGKTVLAFNLLTKLGANEKHNGLGLQNVKYVTKNTQLVNSYLSVLRQNENYDEDSIQASYGRRELNTLFSQINPVLDDRIEYDCLIVDESQRLQQSYQENGEWKQEIIKKLIDKSKNIVFLLDDDQKLAFNDVKFSEQVAALGNINNISILPNMNDDAEKTEYTLYQAFRTFGSREHLNWIDRFLGYEYAQKAKCNVAEGYDICVVDNPDDLFYMVHDKVKAGESARVLAGLCWLWKDENKNKNTVADIKIDDGNTYIYSWNRNNINDWPVNPDTIDEVGCVHTVLGQEFDYAGVIIGNDLRYADGKVLPDPDENTQFMRYDNDRKRMNGMPCSKVNRSSVKKLSQGKDASRMDEAKELVRNHYHILLTRGKKGCYIYCTDPALRDYLCELLGQESPIHYERVCDLPVCSWEEDEEPGQTQEPVEKTESIADGCVVGEVTYVNSSGHYAYVKGDDGIEYAVSEGTYNRLVDPDSILIKGNRVSFSVWKGKGEKNYANNIKLV